MPSSILLLGEMDLRPLLQMPGSMDGAMDAVEQATIDQYLHRDELRERNIRDEMTGAADRNTLRIQYCADDAFMTGFQVYADTGEGPPRPNSRWVAVLDGQTRQLRSVVDYGCLNPVRVGACAGVAARYLAPVGARTAAILGSASIARTLLQAISRAVPGLEEARVYSPTPEHREVYARQMSEWLGLRVHAVESAREATEGADIVGFANNGRGQLVEADWLKPGALIISISAGQFPPSLVAESRVVATSWSSLASHEPFGSFIKAGTYTRQHIAGELAQVILKEVEVRRHPQETVVFELTGVQLWAVRLAHWACQWATSEGVGTPFVLNAE
jgi:alanine dehydrogenase